MIHQRSHLFNKVTIVGVGLMGGSLGLAIKKYQLAHEVIGLSSRQSSLVEAMKYKAIDTASTDIPKAIRQADLVVLATPVDSILRLFSSINPYLKRGCIITDLGSSKTQIVEEAEKVLTGSSFFIGSHPLVGSEKTGVENARAELFENSICIMTPTAKTNQVAKEKIKHLWTRMGSQVKFLSPEKHDETLAFISHLPHLTAFGLMECIPKEHLEFAPQGLKDTTRIAASSPQMWSEIALSNSKNILKTLDDLVKILSSLRKSIVNKDEKILMDHFTRAKQKRDSISNG